MHTVRPFRCSSALLTAVDYRITIGTVLIPIESGFQLSRPAYRRHVHSYGRLGPDGRTSREARWLEVRAHRGFSARPLTNGPAHLPHALAMAGKTRPRNSKVTISRNTVRDWQRVLQRRAALNICD